VLKQPQDRSVVTAAVMATPANAANAVQLRGVEDMIVTKTRIDIQQFESNNKQHGLVYFAEQTVRRDSTSQTCV